MQKNVAGAGLSKDGLNNLQVNAGNGIEIDGDNVAIDIGDDSLQFITGEIRVRTDDITIETVSGVGIRVKAGGINTLQLADDAVTTVKILDGAVATDKIADDAVTRDKIDANVAGAGLGQNTNGSLEVNAGNGIEIDGDAVHVDIADNSLGFTGGDIRVNVDNSTIETDGTDGVRVKDLGIKTQHIANSAVTTNKINDLAVTTNKIADNAVTFNKLSVGVQNRIIGLEDDVQSLKGGVAMAMAIANSPVILDGDKTFSLSVKTARWILFCAYYVPGFMCSGFRLFF